MEDRNMMRKGAAALGGALIAIALAASPVGATPYTQHTIGQSWSDTYDSNGDGTTQSHSIQSGYNTLLGAVECYTVGEPVVIPSESCDGVDFGLVPGAFFTCQSEDGDGVVWGDFFNQTSCIPFSCFDETGYVRVGCETTYSGEIRITGGTGMYEEATGTATYSGTSTFLSSGITFSQDLMGDITLVGDAPPNDFSIEDPAAGSTQSGISLVRGWSCLGGQLEVQFSETDGTAIGEPASLAHGTPRADTEDVCGDTNNGFAMHIDWNILGTGEKTMTLIVNGEERATRNFSVADPDMP